ncbi:MAG TPA: hypothetical protein VK447_08310 [Myxococcaceae bacterium]|nr:hypothetical protein [Myxococcaceae bacterium]
MSARRGIASVVRSARGFALLASSVGGLAFAQETPAPPTVETKPPAHRLSLYAPVSLTVYTSPTRTAGGIGAGLGIRDTIDERFVLQADVSYLMVIGNAGEVRLGAGIQWPGGFYNPAVLVTLSGIFGDRLTFLTPEHPVPSYGPTVTLGLTLAPARFTVGSAQVSLLELGLGAGPELPGLGIAIHLRLLEVGAAF